MPLEIVDSFSPWEPAKLDSTLQATLDRYRQRVESVERLKQCFSRSELPEHEIHKRCMQSLEDNHQMSVLPAEYDIYERFMESLKDVKVLKDAEFSKHLGPLSAEKLPCDAWHKWCNDGVVCFGLIGPDILKIYFGNPRDGSVYHVVDFIFSANGLNLKGDALKVNYTLFGSKVYVFCYYRDWCNFPVYVYHWDVAKPSLDECFKWEEGPNLNHKKHSPLVFSLAGSLYVFGFRVTVTGYDSSFEVLKPDSDKWETLDPPPFTKKRRRNVTNFNPSSLVCQAAKKLLIWSGLPEAYNILCIYDAEQNEWKEVEYPFKDDIPSSCSESFLHVISESFACHAVRHNLGDFLKIASYDPRSLLKFLLTAAGHPFPYLRSGHEYEGLFEMVCERSPNVEYPCKLQGHGATVWKFVSIDFPRGLCLVPCSADKKSGCFVTALFLSKEEYSGVDDGDYPED